MSPQAVEIYSAIAIGCVALVMLAAAGIVLALMLKKMKKLSEAQPKPEKASESAPEELQERFYFNRMIKVTIKQSGFLAELTQQGQDYVLQMMEPKECLIAMKALLLMPVKTVMNLVGTGAVSRSEEQAAMHLLLQALTDRAQEILVPGIRDRIPQ